MNSTEITKYPLPKAKLLCVGQSSITLSGSYVEGKYSHYHIFVNEEKIKIY